MSGTETLDPILPPDLARRARAVLDLACEREMPLITAESCTGGLLAALLTDVPGCSHIFERGFVVYSDDAKCDLLAVDRAQIDRCGAVSREVAVAMVRGALERSGKGVGVAITGFAGPGARTTRKAWSTSPAAAATGRSPTAKSISARSAATGCASRRLQSRWT